MKSWSRALTGAFVALMLSCATAAPETVAQAQGRCAVVRVQNEMAGAALVWTDAGWLGAVPARRWAIMYACGPHVRAAPVVWLWTREYGTQAVRVAIGPHLGTGMYALILRDPVQPGPERRA